jgi:hypothetical protein
MLLLNKMETGCYQGPAITVYLHVRLRVRWPLQTTLPSMSCFLRASLRMPLCATRRRLPAARPRRSSPQHQLTELLRHQPDTLAMHFVYAIRNSPHLEVPLSSVCAS